MKIDLSKYSIEIQPKFDSAGNDFLSVYVVERGVGRVRWWDTTEEKLPETLKYIESLGFVGLKKVRNSVPVRDRDGMRMHMESVNLKTYTEFLMKEDMYGPTRMELQKQLRLIASTKSIQQAKKEVEDEYGLKLTIRPDGTIVDVQEPIFSKLHEE